MCFKKKLWEVILILNYKDAYLKLTKKNEINVTLSKST